VPQRINAPAIDLALTMTRPMIDMNRLVTCRCDQGAMRDIAAWVEA
jgi:hypothetical protein